MKNFFTEKRALAKDLAARGWARFKTGRDNIGHRVEDVLIALSAIAVVLVVFNEFLPHEQFQVPILGISWSIAQQIVRGFTWASFVTVFLVYGFTSHRRIWNYCFKWWLELVICVLWLPFLPPTLIQQFHGIFSLQTLVLIGTVAHVARISGWSRRKLSKHPVWAVGAWTASLITVCTVVLMFVEPQTFTNFHESALSVFMTALTIGGDIRPTTLVGKDVYAMVATAGVGILAVWYGVIREWVQYTVFKHLDATKKILEELAKLLTGVGTNEKLIKQNLALTRQNLKLTAANNRLTSETNRLMAMVVDSQTGLSGRLLRLEALAGIKPGDVVMPEDEAGIENGTVEPDGKTLPDGS